jgi:succinyl-CoA:mesaconate CoA transferase
MYDAMISLCERSIYQNSYTGNPPSRRGNAHPTLFPYNAFEAADGHVVIAAFNDRHWRNLCESMGRPDLAAEYDTATDRLRNRDRLRDEIAAWTRDRSADAIVEELEGSVPSAPVHDTADVFADEHPYAREMLVEVDQPGADQTVTIAGSPIKMSETNPEPGERAPMLDEHREELLDPPRARSDD